MVNGEVLVELPQVSTAEKFVVGGTVKREYIQI